MDIEYNFEKRYRLVREIIETIVLTILMFLIINLAVQNFDVEGPSMEPSLHNLERIMVDKATYMFHQPARGDVVVFIAPPQPSLNYVKRIVALPGDVVTVQGNTVIVDGVTLNEPYVAPSMQGNPFAPILKKVVPPGDYFVLGDDRINSSDSRDWGFLPRKNIIGRAALVYWPLGKDNTGFLPDYSSVFASIQQKPGTAISGPPPNVGSAQVDQLLLLGLPGLSMLSLWGGRKRRL
ncbi:MAG TPA: signal peptidase I [Ktedonosporobacter sp.]|nr:signal peptidase I [Ktedonosporobacter sp.]